MRRRTVYVNEIKTSLTDAEYERLLAYQAAFDVPTVAEAARKLLRQGLFGMVPNLPLNLLSSSEGMGQVGRRVAA